MLIINSTSVQARNVHVDLKKDLCSDESVVLNPPMM